MAFGTHSGILLLGHIHHWTQSCIKGDTTHNFSPLQSQVPGDWPCTYWLYSTKIAEQIKPLSAKHMIMLQQIMRRVIYFPRFFCLIYGLFLRFNAQRQVLYYSPKSSLKTYYTWDINPSADDSKQKGMDHCLPQACWTLEDHKYGRLL